MALHRFQVSIQNDNMLPEDRYVNDWVFDSVDPTIITDFDNVRDMLGDLYQGIANFLPNTLVMPEVLVKAYRMSDTPPRIPVYESAFILTGLGSGQPLPAEVACCTSFHAVYTSGQNPARRKNRKYIGPLTQTASDAGRPAAGFVNSLRDAMVEMAEASHASVRWTWVVYSPTDDEAWPVVGGWVDNAFDTQRRRGAATTARTTWVETS